MPIVDLVVSSEISTSARARQVCSMFDVPPADKVTLRWSGDVPLDQREWSVGLIVGPSGCGKSSVARHLFGERVDPPLVWKSRSVVDDVAVGRGVQEVTDAFSAVGFNTIPAWMRPFAVLSNGERFRVELARRLLEAEDLVVVDEFTSVVDRQVAKCGSHAVAKYARRSGKKFVAVACHYDIVDWLQPDWILEPATMTFAWRSVQPRPKLDVEIKRVPYDAWRLFAPYHYLTAELNRAAKCFVAFVEGRPTSLVAALHFPHPKVRDIMRASRGVTLPDWQGLGLFFALNDTIASAYSALGKRFRLYPAHPAFVRSAQRSSVWRAVMESGLSNRSTSGRTTTLPGKTAMGVRPCAVFEYVGPHMNRIEALALIGGSPA